jgi:large subunit ribosomal protein L6
MSRIGGRPITIEDGVNVEATNSKVTVNSGSNTLSLDIPAKLTVKVVDGRVVVERASSERDVRAKHGLVARLIKNMINGVKNSFTKDLEFNGTGYRAAVAGEELVLNMGYSHEIRLQIPAGIKVTVVKNTISVNGIEKDKVGEFAAKIREVRPPEVYKGKGIKYKGEYIRRKAGKTAASK